MRGAKTARDPTGITVFLDEPERPLLRFAGKLWAPVPWMLEAAVIAAFPLFNAARSSFQEGEAQGTLDRLKASLEFSASVHRDGAWSTI